jgi:hypothetical protein
VDGEVWGVHLRSLLQKELYFTFTETLIPGAYSWWWGYTRRGDGYLLILELKFIMMKIGPRSNVLLVTTQTFELDCHRVGACLRTAQSQFPNNLYDMQGPAKLGLGSMTTEVISCTMKMTRRRSSKEEDMRTPRTPKVLRRQALWNDIIFENK